MKKTCSKLREWFCSAAKAIFQTPFNEEEREHEYEEYRAQIMKEKNWNSYQMENAEYAIYLMRTASPLGNQKTKSFLAKLQQEQGITEKDLIDVMCPAPDGFIRVVAKNHADRRSPPNFTSI